jgi:Tfp pilus assembly pilus retraction ATPase PilT
MLRIDGRIVPTEYRPLSADEARQSLYAIMSSEQRERFEKNKEMDMSLMIDGLARFRMNVYKARWFGVPPEPIPMDELNLPPVLSSRSSRAGWSWSPAPRARGSRPRSPR